jgi:hypothetical protein
MPGALELVPQSKLHGPLTSLSAGNHITQHPPISLQHAETDGLPARTVQNGNLTELTQEITFPPVRWMENPKERPRLEAAILITGTPALCPGNQQTADQWLRTNMH